MFVSRLFRGRNVCTSAYLKSSRNFQYVACNPVEHRKLLHNKPSGDIAQIKNITPRTYVISDYPTHLIQPRRNRSKKQPAQDDRPKLPDLPIVMLTFRYSFKFFFAYLKDKDIATKIGITGPKFLKGLVYAFHSVTTEIAARNIEYLENILTDECLEKVKAGEGIVSDAVSAIEPVDSGDVVGIRLLDLKIKPIPGSDLKDLDILVQLIYQKGYNEMKRGQKTPSMQEMLTSRFANITFTRRFGEHPEDLTDWLIKNLFFYMYNDQKKNPKKL